MGSKDLAALVEEPRPTLSVIIANYNHSRFIDRALRSLTGQTVPPLEIIILDDASTDDSFEKLLAWQKADPKIRVLRNERNLGCNKTTNRGFDIARGDYVYAMGMDDVVLPTFVERCTQALRQAPGAGLCWSDNTTVEETTGERSSNPLALSSATVHLSPSQLAALMHDGRVPCLSGHSSVLRRDAVLQIGGYLEPTDTHADGFLTLMIALRHGACYIPAQLTETTVTSSSFLVEGTRDPARDRAALAALADLALDAKFADVYPLFKHTAYLGFYRWRMLRVMLQRRERLSLLTLRLFMKVLWFSSKMAAGRIAGPRAKRAYGMARDVVRRRLRRPVETART